MKDELGEYLVIDSNYSKLITMDIENLYSQISKILNEYNLNTKFNNIDYKQYNENIIKSRKQKKTSHI